MLKQIKKLNPDSYKAIKLLEESGWTIKEIRNAVRLSDTVIRRALKTKEYEDWSQYRPIPKEELKITPSSFLSSGSIHTEGREMAERIIKYIKTGQ